MRYAIRMQQKRNDPSNAVIVRVSAIVEKRRNKKYWINTLLGDDGKKSVFCALCYWYFIMKLEICWKWFGSCWEMECYNFVSYWNMDWQGDRIVVSREIKEQVFGIGWRFVVMFVLFTCKVYYHVCCGVILFYMLLKYDWLTYELMINICVKCSPENPLLCRSTL